MNLLQICKKFCGLPIAPIAIILFAATMTLALIITSSIGINGDLELWIAGLAFAGSSFACMVSLAIGIGCTDLALLIYHMITLGSGGIARELYREFVVDAAGMTVAYFSGTVYLRILLKITNAPEVTMLMDTLHLVLWISGINTVLFITLIGCIGWTTGDQS